MPESDCSRKYLRTLTAEDMRQVNRTAVLDLLRRGRPLSRSAIASELDLSLPTVMRIIDDLIRSNLAHELPGAISTGGRPPVLVEFNARQHAVIGVDLGGTHMFAAAADLSGRILTSGHIPLATLPENGVFPAMVSLIQGLLTHPDLQRIHICGIGVGAPGITHVEEGRVIFAPALGWEDFPLRDKLAEKFDLPIAVENDVNLAALGEHWFGVGQDCTSMVLLAVGTGIGAGIILNHHIHHGASNSAGEVGYMLPGVDFLRKKYPGFGALELAASGHGIALQAAALNDRPPSDQAITSEKVFISARKGEPWAVELVSRVADYLSIAIANTAALLDPELIVLSGGIFRSPDLLLPVIKENISGRILQTPRIELSKLDKQAAVLGAAVLVLHDTEYFLPG